ncbi:MAG: NusG domain II-containing protein [Firmicutes bacterium]|jgi:hypothetical protein|nr:NusG domain II-containing protein [Bacillota bacterium]
MVTRPHISKLMLICIILLVGTGLIWSGHTPRRRRAGGGVLRISTIGRDRETVVDTIRLTEDGPRRVLEVSGPLGTTEIEVDGLRARVIASPCPDKICISMGWLSREGDFAACLPNRVLVTVDSPDRD